MAGGSDIGGCHESDTNVYMIVVAGAGAVVAGDDAVYINQPVEARTMVHDDNGKKMGKAIAKAWSDEKYRAKLRANPGAVLAEEGISVPAGTNVKLVEDSEHTAHIVLPLQPKHAGA